MARPMQSGDGDLGSKSRKFPKSGVAFQGSP